MTSRPVAVDVLTGFLGSGKTTLLSHVLSHGLAGKRVAVVVNEIGEIGLDGRVITGLASVEKAIELASGCICCSIDEYRFDLAIQELVETVAPDLIVIESTGVADPEPLAYRVKNAGLRLDAIIAVVDAANVEHVLDETVVAALQIAAADFLVVNKTDLVTPADVERVRRRLARLNARALHLESVRGAIDADVLFATDVAAHRDSAARARSTHMATDAFETFAYRSTVPLAKPAFERLLHELPGDVIRAKGIVRFAAHEWHCVFSVTCGRVDLGWLKLGDTVTENQAVFIGRNLARHRDTILTALTRCERADG